ncbi:hypothetical protein [Planctomicrobium piriforme]|nr:hypothetical protein [Planctomicrobium piriforme]
MFSPFEELEYLADYLPEEGEAVLITRESGELVCKPYAANDLRDGVDDAELYGLLVQSNERLNRRGLLPLWLAATVIFFSAIILHGILGLSWHRWYLIPGVTILTLYGSLFWIRVRRNRLFRSEILPVIMRELGRRRIRPYSLLAGVRQHGELRTLMDELIRWTPERQLPMT